MNLRWDTILLVVFFLLFLSSGFECKHSTEPPLPPPGNDTTSHEFIWRFDTLGEGSSSLLRDVVILGDSLAYAVGELYFRDSTGQWDWQPYNVARWDGSQWSLTRATYVPLRAVFAFGPNDMWAGSSAPYHWDGTKWFGFNVNGIYTGYINRFWGTSSQDIYLVATNGSMAHYDGVSWKAVASGTTLDIGDIYGAMDYEKAELQILAVAGNTFISNDRKILSVRGNTVSPLSDGGISYALGSVWFIPNKHYYAVGDGVYEKGDLSEATWKNSTSQITRYYTNEVRGNAANDVFVCGAYGELLHFNGRSWRSYRSQTGLVNGQYYAVATRGNLVIAVGEDPPRAVVAIGRR